jgi:hypothetical protein
MLADDFYGLDGWTVDRVRVQYPGDLVDVEGPAVRPFAISPPWPNPARESLRLEATIARHVADARWSLFDVQGRHVATLWRGALDPGERVLEGRLARTLGPGLYFSRLTLDGVEAARARVAISR